MMVRIQACTRKQILVKYITARYINKTILEKIQRRAVSTMASGLKGVTYKEKLVKVGIPTIRVGKNPGLKKKPAQWFFLFFFGLFGFLYIYLSRRGSF
jgi:hypothetical protein